MITNEFMNYRSLTIDFVNSLSTKWSQQFENTPEFPFIFTINQDDLLCFNNTPLCPYSELNLNYECIDIEWFSFETLSEDTFYFLINWPYDSDIESVTIYKKDEVVDCVSASHLKLAGNF